MRALRLLSALLISVAPVAAALAQDSTFAPGWGARAQLTTPIIPLAFSGGDGGQGPAGGAGDGGGENGPGSGGW